MLFYLLIILVSRTSFITSTSGGRKYTSVGYLHSIWRTARWNQLIILDVASLAVIFKCCIKRDLQKIFKTAWIKPKPLKLNGVISPTLPLQQIIVRLLLKTYFIIIFVKSWRALQDPENTISLSIYYRRSIVPITRLYVRFYSNVNNN